MHDGIERIGICTHSFQCRNHTLLGSDIRFDRYDIFYGFPDLSVKSEHTESAFSESLNSRPPHSSVCTGYKYVFHLILSIFDINTTVSTCLGTMA